MIAEDKEIYLRFKEWMDVAQFGLPKKSDVKPDTIEELQNLLALAQEALKFYANPDNYTGTKNAGSCCGTPYSLIDADEGSQARFAIEQSKQLMMQNQKLQDDYDKLLLEVDSFEPEGETNPMELIKIFTETHTEEDNLTKMRRQGNENPNV